MAMNERTIRYRKVLKLIVYGEIGAVISVLYLFGTLAGLYHLVHMWIDYIAYASCNYCSVLILAMVAAMELIMLFLNANDGTKRIEGLINDSNYPTLSMVLFYSLIAWAGTKMVVVWRIYKEFKLATEGYPEPVQRQGDDDYMRAAVNPEQQRQRQALRNYADQEQILN